MKTKVELNYTNAMHTKTLHALTVYMSYTCTFWQGQRAATILVFNIYFFIYMHAQTNAISEDSC